MINCLVVGVGGFVGATLRYLMGLLPFHEGSFPIHTFLINFIGTFCIGLFAGLILKYDLNPTVQLFLKTGLCGGFSTLAAVTLESNALIAEGKWYVAAAYLAATVLVCLFATYLGEQLVK